MILAELIAVLHSIAPPHLAEAWDNVGLLVGDPAQPVSRVLLTIDYTPEVAAEVAREAYDAVVAYHPPIFKGIKRIEGRLLDAARRGIAIYSPHTALDVADDGTNDMLADALGLVERGPLRHAEAKTRDVKLVVFVPEEALDQVSRALFEAGAGRIGNYTSCSFRTKGTGTFFGDDTTNPAVGAKGKLEQVDELRLETVVPLSRVASVINALRRAHPYEEPAFDLVTLAAPPRHGMGRIGTMVPIERGALIEQVKGALGVRSLLVAGPTGGLATKAAACAGSAGDFLHDALAQRADVYLTGELRHHDALRAAEAGMTVIAALHSASERAILPRVADRIRTALPNLAVAVSSADRDPFRFV